MQVFSQAITSKGIVLYARRTEGGEASMHITDAGGAWFSGPTIYVEGLDPDVLAEAVSAFNTVLAEAAAQAVQAMPAEVEG